MSEVDQRIKRVGRAKAVVIAAAIAGSVGATVALGLQSGFGQTHSVNGVSTNQAPQGQGGIGISTGSGGPAHATTKGS